MEYRGTDEIKQGATYRRVFDAQPVLPALNLDLTGATVVAKLENDNGDIAATFACSVLAPRQVQIELTDEITAALTPTTSYFHHYTVIATAVDGISYWIAHVRVTILAR